MNEPDKDSNFPHTARTPSHSPIIPTPPEKIPKTPHNTPNLFSAPKQIRPKLIKHAKKQKPLPLPKVVHNLSNLVLDKPTLSLLEKGLSFCPTPPPLRKCKSFTEETNVETKKLHHKLMYKYIFRYNKKSMDRIYLPSSNSPQPSDSPLINSYSLQTKKLIKKHLKSLMNNPDPIPNLPFQERKALTKLEKNPQIVIKPADKGSGIVILNTNIYILGCLDLLQNTKYYKKIKFPLSRSNSIQFNKILFSLFSNKHITNREYTALKPPPIPRSRLFYALPKIHKDPTSWSNPSLPPLRPIISAVNSESHQIGKFLDLILQPLSTRHPSYIKDTWHFLDQISVIKCPQDCLLYSLDVSGLYSNIHLGQCLTIARNALNSRNSHSPPTQDLIKLLSISIRCNDFTFGGNRYLQTLGIAMGSPFAPSLANLFLADQEKTIDAYIHAQKLPKPLYWGRYLDDIFIIYPNDPTSFTNILEFMNTIDPNIKYTQTNSTTTLDFLDISVFKGPRFQSQNILDHKGYYKPTDLHLYLHPSSAHPPSVFKAVLKTMFLRISRLCNNIADKEKMTLQMSQFFVNRGYSIKSIAKVLRNIHTPKKPIPDQLAHNPRTPFILTYHPSISPLTTILSQPYQQLLTKLKLFPQDLLYMDRIYGGPPMIAYRKPKNIKNSLVRAKIIFPDSILNPVPNPNP